MVAILMISANLTNLDLFKIKIYLHKGGEVIFFLQDVTIKILSSHLNYIVDVVI